MEWYAIGLICFGFLILLIAGGVPVAFALSFVSIVVMVFIWGVDGLMTVATTAYTTNASFLLIAIPLFIFMGECVAVSGVGNDAFKMVDTWFGWLPGGVALTAVGVATIFGAVTGFAPATVSALGPAIIPEMIKRKYDKSFGLGALAGGAGLAIIIPPSILMIIYGSLCEISVGRLFYAGVFPGIILGAIFAAYIITRAIINPALAPPPETPNSTFVQKLRATVYLLPFMALIALVLGSIWGGVASPSEAAALGAFGSIILLFYYRRFSWRTIKRILLATVRTNCMVMFILIGGTLFTQVMVQIGLASELAHWVTSLQVSRWVVFSFMQFVILVTGCFLDPASLLFILIPILLPTVKAHGFDLYWFGIRVMINCSVATITPPVGIVLYVLKAVSPRGVDLQDIVRGAGIYWVLYFIGMLPVIIFPKLVHWLPSFIIGS